MVFPFPFDLKKGHAQVGKALKSNVETYPDFEKHFPTINSEVLLVNSWRSLTRLEMQRIVSRGQVQQWYATVTATEIKQDRDNFNKENPEYAKLRRKELDEDAEKIAELETQVKECEQWLKGPGLFKHDPELLAKDTEVLKSRLPLMQQKHRVQKDVFATDMAIREHRRYVRQYSAWKRGNGARATGCISYRRSNDHLRQGHAVEQREESKQSSTRASGWRAGQELGQI